MKKEKIITVLCPYKQISNSFSVAIKNNKGLLVAEQFYKCREIFHEDFPYTKNLIVCTPPYKKKRLYNTFEFIEKHLNIKNKSKIFLTQRKNLFYVKLSDFWKSKIKFSLLTLLIRSGLKINDDISLEKMATKLSYLKKTKEALYVFFTGNTRYYGKNSSWFKEFKDKSAEESAKLLKKANS